MCGANDSGQLGVKQSSEVEGAVRVEALVGGWVSGWRLHGH
jgi:hypothetical protein